MPTKSGQSGDKESLSHLTFPKGFVAKGELTMSPPENREDRKHRHWKRTARVLGQGGVLVPRRVADSVGDRGLLLLGALFHPGLPKEDRQWVMSILTSLVVGSVGYLSARSRSKPPTAPPTHDVQHQARAELRRHRLLRLAAPARSPHGPAGAGGGDRPPDGRRADDQRQRPDRRGVHALGQVVHFYTTSRHAPEVFVKALNATPPDHVVAKLKPLPILATRLCATL